MEETLAKLGRDGARLGVLTNKPHEMAAPLLDGLNLSRHFGAILGAGSRPYTKPDPRIFEDVVNELGGGRPRRDGGRFRHRS